MQSRDLRVKGAHGAELHLLEWSTEGVPMLLLHGFGNQAHIWDDFAPVVAAHGVETVTAALGIERMVLVGHSLGGRVSTLFAGRHPARLAGLVIVDIGPEVDRRGSLRIRQDVEMYLQQTFSRLE